MIMPQLLPAHNTALLATQSVCKIPLGQLPVFPPSNPRTRSSGSSRKPRTIIWPLGFVVQPKLGDQIWQLQDQNLFSLSAIQLSLIHSTSFPYSAILRHITVPGTHSLIVSHSVKPRTNDKNTQQSQHTLNRPQQANRLNQNDHFYILLSSENREGACRSCQMNTRGGLHVCITFPKGDWRTTPKPFAFLRFPFDMTILDFKLDLKWTRPILRRQAPLPD